MTKIYDDFMTKKEQAWQERQRLIAYLETQVVEKANPNGGGSICLVPSVSGFEQGKNHRVEVDENYVVHDCSCPGGRGECMHRVATRRALAARGTDLVNSTLNPVYQFERNGKLIKARLSQFSSQEKAALRQAQEEARKRAIYEASFDVNGLAFIA